MWRLAWKWARHAHPNKSRHWVTARYFGMFNPSRNDKWLLGSRDTGRYLRRFSWTKIVRHVMVAGRASPDDPGLAEYWAKRRERNRPPVSPATWHLLRRQRGRCPLCRGLLLYASHEPHDEREWEQWHTVIRKAIRKEAVGLRDGPRHAWRASRIPSHPRTLPPTSSAAASPAFLQARSLKGLLEPSCGDNSAWPVLRGRRRGNAPPLPDEHEVAFLALRHTLLQRPGPALRRPRRPGAGSLGAARPLPGAEQDDG